MAKPEFMKRKKETAKNVVAYLNNHLENHIDDLYDYCDTKKSLIEQYGFVFDEDFNIEYLVEGEPVSVEKTPFQIEKMIDKVGPAKVVAWLWRL